MIGNFIGDFVKGKAFEKMDQEVASGVILHREIDRYTDQHEIVRSSKKRLQKKYHHYSPVIIDMFYDHFLAVNWGNYCEVELLPFTEEFYKTTEKHIHHLPEKAAQMLKYMKGGNWLYHYSSIEGIDQALTGMARRTKFESKMEQASADLKLYYDDFQTEFESFFPELIEHSRTFLTFLK